jgi:DNA polymerase-3 subunit delta'
MAWQGIEGHDAIAARFAAAAARGRVSGSYLFVGPSGVGKGTFARALAKALACHAASADLVACGRCGSCIQADAGSNPDIDVVAKPEERSTIPLDAFIGPPDNRMREGLCWRIKLRPAVGNRKTAIILDADALTEEAANSLLKTLEEPPESAVIILVGTAVERQLPTIRSRCQVVRFAPLAPDVVRAILALEPTGEPLDAGRLAAAANACGGSLTRGRLLLDPAVAAFRATLLQALGRRPIPGVELSRDTIALVDAAGKEAPARRARLRIVLETAVEFFRAALRQEAAGERPADPALARAIGGQSADVDELAGSLQQTLAALAAVDRNANPTVVVDAWTAMLEEPRLAQAARLA